MNVSEEPWTRDFVYPGHGCVTIILACLHRIHKVLSHQTQLTSLNGYWYTIYSVIVLDAHIECTHSKVWVILRLRLVTMKKHCEYSEQCYILRHLLPSTSNCTSSLPSWATLMKANIKARNYLYWILCLTPYCYVFSAHWESWLCTGWHIMSVSHSPTAQLSSAAFNSNRKHHVGIFGFHIWVPYLGSIFEFHIWVPYLGSIFGFQRK